MPNHNNHIHAIYDDQLELYLRSLGLLPKIEREQIKCKFCGEIITIDNIHAIFPDSGMIHICCASPDCVIKLSSYLDARGKAVE